MPRISETETKEAARLRRREAALAARPGMSPQGPAVDRLRVATWNLNSLRARLPAVERLLDRARPDIVCLQETKAATVQPAARGGISPWVFVLATAANAAIAAVLAVVITLNVARHDGAPSEADKLAAGAAAATKAAAEMAADPAGEPAMQRWVQLQPVGSREEPLQLEASKPARLPLQLRPEEAMEDSYILLLSGLPAKATLSGVSPMGTDSWLVSP